MLQLEFLPRESENKDNSQSFPQDLPQIENLMGF